MNAWDGKTERRQDILLQTRLQRIEEQVTEIHHALFGNGVPERGHIVRMDRVEQTLKLAGWVLGVVTTTTLGLLIAQLWRTLGGLL